MQFGGEIAAVHAEQALQVELGSVQELRECLRRIAAQRLRAVFLATRQRLPVVDEARGGGIELDSSFPGAPVAATLFDHAPSPGSGRYDLGTKTTPRESSIELSHEARERGAWEIVCGQSLAGSSDRSISTAGIGG